MDSREKILQAVKQAQPTSEALPPQLTQPIVYEDVVTKFKEVATAIGSAIMEVPHVLEAKVHLQNTYIPALREKWAIHHELRTVSTLPEMEGLAEPVHSSEVDPHSYEDVDLVIMSASFGVAENSALWVPETWVRVLPFIGQHLVLLVAADQLVSNMHQAYERMGLGGDGFAAFIAGPSKTADIEQSLVLGAHGPRSLGIYLLG